MMDKIEYIKECVYEAGNLLRASLSSEINVDSKKSFNDLVTNMDRSIEQFLVARINEKYPNQSFLTEEETVSQIETDDLWIIDPIDGTVNFVFQQKDFAVSIAYYHKHQPVFGLVYNVMDDKMYVGITGQGAYCNDEKLKTLKDVQLRQSVLYSGLGALKHLNIDLSELGRHILAFRYMGAVSLEICGVASGHHQIYISRECSIWDIAAATIILKEVGGSFNFGSHDIIDFSNVSYFFSCASNRNIMNELLSLGGQEHETSSTK